MLRTVRGGDDGAFVPHASVTLGVLLSVASVGALVYFIHHVSFSLTYRESRDAAQTAADRRDLERRYRAALASLAPPASTSGGARGEDAR